MPEAKKKRPVHPVIIALREERIRRKISLVGMGKLTGYCNQHIWQIETGLQGARIEIVDDLAAALGMKLKLEGKDE